MQKEKKPKKNQEQPPAPEETAPAQGQYISDEQMSEWAEQIQTLQREREEYLDMARRCQADLDNYRKRNANLRLETIAEGRADTAAAMLPVLDNMQRALDAAPDGPLKEGVQMTMRQMLEALGKLGLSEIAAQDAPFDPQVHHAVLRTPAAEGLTPGHVTQVLQKGYLFGDKVLRAAMVAVCEE